MTEKPWLKFYPDIPEDITLPDATMYELMAATAARWPDLPALNFLGRTLSFAQLMREVDVCAAGFTALGVTARDSVVLSLPNVPHAVIAFYALNKLGARAVMTHPLSSRDELVHYITISEARWAVTVDLFYPMFASLAKDTGLERLVIGRIPDYLSAPLKVGFALTKGRKIAPVPADALVVTWKDFLAGGRAAGSAGGAAGAAYSRPIARDETAVILFSGGTTNLPKGIELSSDNFNALALSLGPLAGAKEGDSVLAILPVFHGFGLGLCIHTIMSLGGLAILVPEFSPQVYIDNLIKYQPSFIAGVPTLFEALLRNPKFKEVRFERLKGAYSGGDLLSPDLKRRFDEAIMAQGSPVELMEGYGLTEAVTACAISPQKFYRDSSMGIPAPGMLVQVCDATTGAELPFGTEGEICVYGPTLMKGYLKDPEATAAALREHADGRVWLHTGDIGWMDPDGYFYFKGRMKRIIKVSGMSVYPMAVEQVLESHKDVNRACVIGVPDDYQVSRLKAFIILNEGVEGSDAVKADIIAYAKEHLIKWSVPKDIEFRTTFPMTKVGKIAFTELEKEELEKLAGKAG